MGVQGPFGLVLQPAAAFYLAAAAPICALQAHDMQVVQRHGGTVLCRRTTCTSHAKKGALGLLWLLSWLSSGAPPVTGQLGWRCSGELHLMRECTCHVHVHASVVYGRRAHQRGQAVGLVVGPLHLKTSVAPPFEGRQADSPPWVPHHQRQRPLYSVCLISRLGGCAGGSISRKRSRAGMPWLGMQLILVGTCTPGGTPAVVPLWGLTGCGIVALGLCQAPASGLTKPGRQHLLHAVERP